jgi:hypothetical protein
MTHPTPAILWFHPSISSEDWELAFVLASLHAPALGDGPIELRAEIEIPALEGLLDADDTEREALQARTPADSLVHPAQCRVAARLLTEAATVRGWLAQRGLVGVRCVTLRRPLNGAAVRLVFDGDGRDGSARREAWDRECFGG